jgi:biopolymer transport protein ExbD
MKLSKTSVGEDFVMDMTPMIDVVFQLIIFFMLLMDMSTKELELLKLPKAESAVEDKPDPKDPRPIVNILPSGRIIVKGEVVYDPDNDDGYKKLTLFLAGRARLMKEDWIDPLDHSKGKAPDRPILVRADQSTPFKYIQKVMEKCGEKEIKIWKIELAAGEDKPAGAAPTAGGQ